MEDELVKNGRDESGGKQENEQSVGEAVGVISAEEQKQIEEKRDKKFIG